MASGTQIVATIGPSSGTEGVVQTMIASGMDIARLNFSHGTHDTSAAYIAAIRAAAAAAGVRIPVMQDLSGPRATTSEGHAFDTKGPEITEKDRIDLDFGAAHKVDYIAQSYVGAAADVRAMREEMRARGIKAPLIAKIERQEAVDAFDDICAEADAIMIARGDLGLAVPIERIPFIQRDIIARCKRAGKPAITATQMLLSMTKSPVPTRAEVTDVAYAVLCGTDAVMLSEESAIGAYPVDAVRVMERIVAQAEREAARNPLIPLS